MNPINPKLIHENPKSNPGKTDFGKAKKFSTILLLEIISGEFFKKSKNAAIQVKPSVHL